MTKLQNSRTAQTRKVVKADKLGFMEQQMVNSAYSMFLASADSMLGRLAYECLMENGLLRPQPLLKNDTSLLGAELKDMARRRKTTTKDFLARLVVVSGTHHPHILVRLLTNKLVWSIL